MLSILALVGAKEGEAAQKAGIAAAVVGNVAVTPEGTGSGQQATSGMEMFLGDHVTSDAESRMQMLLLDETVFSIGPNSDLVIDEFVYDPATGDGKVAATFTKGLVRYVSGRVAKAQPDNVSIKLPVGTMGIRGTAVMLIDYEHAKGKIPDMKPEDTAAVLLGPGPRNNVNTGRGGFEIATPNGTVAIDRAGYGVLLTPGRGAGPVFRTPPDLIALLQTQITAAPQNAPHGGAGGFGGSASKASGQAAAEGEATAKDQGSLNSKSAALNDGVTKASEELNRTPQLEKPKPPTPIPEPIPEPVNEIINGALNQGLGRLPNGVTIPWMVMAAWDRSGAAGSFFDLDLHLTGPDSTGGTFHVYYDNTGNYTAAPFALQDADGFGATASEVIGLSRLNSGGDYLASVYNFGDPRTNGTTLSDADTNLVVSLIRNGTVSRGAHGSVAIAPAANVITRVSPVDGQVGNTFQAFTFDNTGTPTTVQTTTSFASPDLVK